ncbi:MAG: penicillin-binding protein 1C, partial [Verrucomicrobia bacterium]|nr:penicillin-binding protein 1C [Verrucomicrobiota bacterium]
LPKKLLQPLPASPTFLAADGTPLRQMLSADGQRVAQPVNLPEIPVDLIHATLAAEDRRFFSHGGVDLPAIARAAWDNLMARRVVSGASTITQQLAKISADERKPRRLWTKVIEALQARRIEMTWSKERILEEYLNRVGYGNLLIGCSSAAQGYFDKPLRDLSPAECSMLAALPQAPSRLNPFTNFKAVQSRQKFVLDGMVERGWLTLEKRALAGDEKIVLQRFNGGFEAPHAIELVCGPGLKPGPQVIHTTILPTLQSRMESIIARRLAALRDRHVTQAAAVVIENKTGRVLALAGSRDFFSNEGGQINGAWAPHSAGSAVKPFTYLLALQREFTPASIIPDLPIEFSTPGGIYRPENYDHRNYGPVTLRTALGSSLNIPAVRVLKQIGGEKVLYDTLKNLGITSLTEPADHYGLGLTIGNAPVRLIELTNAYACLARLGEYKPWTLLVDAPEIVNTRLFPQEVCYQIADILGDNQARLPTFGPWSVIRLPFKVAVKTGTSRNYRDNWTIGYSPEFTVGVWAGNFDHTPMENVSGVTGAGPIFRDIFLHLRASSGTSWFDAPTGIVHAKIDPRTGHQLPDSGMVVRMSRPEIFLGGALPVPAKSEDYEAETGRAFLSDEYARWISQGDHWLVGLVCVRPSSNSSRPPRILSPVDGSVVFLDPDLSDGGRRMLLQSQEGMAVNWSSLTLRIEGNDGAPMAWLVPGRHEITATDLKSGLETTASVEVRDATEFAAQRRSKMIAR